ncbi:MAG: hypothetical protein PWR24_1782 [Desulfonauticus sp.]|jgi:3-phosphoshikimate 1-carboxyvinyltransferase|nr:hypothetical protein [Desulfonauticus sp.]
MSEKKYSLSLNEELYQTEKNLLKLIQKRTRLLSKIAKNRFEQGKSPVDTLVEKKLWDIWKSSLQGENQRFFRQIFSILNNTSYLKAETKQFDKPFCLYPPSSKEIDFHTEAPLSNFQARLSLILATLSTTETHISPFPINDPLVELIKALNQMGGRVSWQENSLHVGPADLYFEGKSIFLGEDEFNFYLLLSLCLTQAGSCKLNGASKLKMLNLKELQDFLPTLGARLTSIEPQSYNLPARLECSGHLPSEVVLPESISEYLGIGLILASFLRQRPLKLTWSKPFSKLKELEKLARDWNLSLSIEEDTILVQPQEIKSPANFKIEADPVLSSYVLVLPHFLGGKIQLTGLWPAYSLEAQRAQKIFQEINLDFDSENFLAQKNREFLKELSLDVDQAEDFLPLATALVLSCEKGGIIYHNLKGEPLESAQELLSFLGLKYHLHPEYLEIENSQLKFQKHNDKVWTSPSPFWTLSYALISFKFKGICLSNPGIITQIWPRFWKLFQSLPLGKIETKEEVKNDNQTTKRRIRIR